MIEIVESFKVEGQGELKVQLVPSNTCMTVLDPSRTAQSGDVLAFVVQLQDSSCFENTLTLFVEDDNCTKQFTFLPQDPCGGLNGTIAHTPDARNPYKFTLGIAGGQPPYSVDWGFDTSVFSLQEPPTNNRLFLRGSNPPETVLITAAITDSNGCESAAEFILNTCKPTLNPPNARLGCPPVGRPKTFNFPLRGSSPCVGATIDWSTLQISGGGLIFENNGDGTVDITGTTPGEVLVSATVSDSSGAESSVATFIVDVPQCAQSQNPVVFGENIVLDSSDSIGDTKVNAVQAVGVGDDDIDWSTFTFVAAAGQTLNSASNLTSTNGTAEFICAGREIRFTIGTKNENVDLVQFEVQSKDGKLTNRGKWYYDFENFQGATAADDTITLALGEKQVLDLAANDSGPFKLGSFEIVSGPANNLVTIDADGKAVITAQSEGSDSFDYRYRTPDGVLSTTATVSITAQSAGVPINQTICPITHDLNSFLAGDVTAGGAWSADAANPGTPSIASPSSVDFSGQPAGLYKFTYTVGSSTATIQLTIAPSTASIDAISPPSNNTLAAAIQSTVRFRALNVESIANIAVEVQGPTTTETYSPTTFNTPFGSALIEYHEGAGNYTVTLKAIDACGTENTDSENITV